jgi:hypothetical protein
MLASPVRHVLKKGRLEGGAGKKESEGNGSSVWHGSDLTVMESTPAALAA